MMLSRRSPVKTGAWDCFFWGLWNAATFHVNFILFKFAPPDPPASNGYFPYCLLPSLRMAMLTFSPTIGLNLGNCIHTPMYFTLRANVYFTQKSHLSQVHCSPLRQLHDMKVARPLNTTVNVSGSHRPIKFAFQETQLTFRLHGFVIGNASIICSETYEVSQSILTQNKILKKEIKKEKINI